MSALEKGLPEEELSADDEVADDVLDRAAPGDEADVEAPDVEAPDVEAPDYGAVDRERAPHLRVAPTTSRDVLRRRRRARFAVFSVAALSAASMFLLVAFHVFAAQSAFTLDKLDTQLSTEQRHYGLLRDRVATLSSPEAVAKAAASLGMVRPSEVTLVHAPTAASFGSNAGLPAPPITPYSSIGAGP